MEAGKLFLIPTPVGNLEDMTLRAIRYLKEADIVLAEDTRVSSRLFQHYEINQKAKAFHLANEHKVVDYWIEQLQNGQKIAIVSDAGTPGISDPGYMLSAKCRELNIDVECLPGATAFVPALVASGLPSDKFYFEGFLPHKKGKQTRMEILSQMPCTVIMYESPHRIAKSLKMMAEICPERRVTLAREISKKFEEYINGTVQEVAEIAEERALKGEMVIVMEGKND